MAKDDFRALMKRWERALESYGIPGNFADNTYVELLEGDKDSVPIKTIIAPGFANRKSLMIKQKEETEKRKKENKELRWENDGNSCFLCDNIGQAKDIGNNLILAYDTFEDYVLIPNKYPMDRGHFLFCQKKHDKDYKMTQKHIELMINLCDHYKLNIVRNHKKAGMSILNHEHTHLHPRLLRGSNGEKISLNGLEKCTLEDTDYGNDVFSVSGTDFDTLAFKTNAVNIFCKVLKNLEAEEKIFTFFYEPSKGRAKEGIFFLTPHKKQDRKGRMAGNTGLYFELACQNHKPNYNKFINLYKEFLYTKGSFDWSKYLK